MNSDPCPSPGQGASSSRQPDDQTVPELTSLEWLDFELRGWGED